LGSCTGILQFRVQGEESGQQDPIDSCSFIDPQGGEEQGAIQGGWEKSWTFLAGVVAYADMVESINHGSQPEGLWLESH
jgi:hypothetical protein